MKNTTAVTAEDMARYEAQVAILKDEIDALNAELGLDAHKITFGYIGNARHSSNGWDMSTVSWMVFLPHPGRVGTSGDSFGGFRQGDIKGIVAARMALKAFGQGARFAKGL